MKIHPTLEGHSRDRLGDYYPSSSLDDSVRDLSVQPLNPAWRAQFKANEAKIRREGNKEVAINFIFGLLMLAVPPLILWYFITGGSQ